MRAFEHATATDMELADFGKYTLMRFSYQPASPASSLRLSRTFHWWRNAARRVAATSEILDREMESEHESDVTHTCVSPMTKSYIASIH